jgi:hypothetical protein
MRLQFRDNRMISPLTSRHMESPETQRTYRPTMIDVICIAVTAHLNGVYPVAFLILLLAAKSVSAGFSGGL